MGILEKKQKDICDLNAFSYEDYKNSSLDLKLKKIELLNSFYRARYNNLPKLPIFIDILCKKFNFLLFILFSFSFTCFINCIKSVSGSILATLMFL